MVALTEYKDAIAAFKKGLEIEPESVGLKKGLRTTIQTKNKLEAKKKQAFQSFFSQNEIYEPLKETPKEEYHNAANPTAFFDICIGDAEPERLEIELFETVVPKTVANFKALCTGEKGEASWGAPLHFKDSIFHRLIGGFMLQGGDIQNSNGTGGESIYGNKFEDENFTLKHKDRGMLSMANSGPGTNGSQFFITFSPTPHLDGKHVVFGKVTKNIELLDTIEAVETGQSDLPMKEIRIMDCGVTEAPAVEVDLVPEIETN